MQEVLSVDCTIDNQRGTAVISTDQVKVKAAFVTQNVFLAVVIILLVLSAIVEIYIQLLAFRLNPPLPGGQDVLNVDVGPFVAVGNHAVNGIFQAMAGIKAGYKGVAVDDGTLGDISCNTVESLVFTGTDAHILILRIGGTVSGIAGLRGILEGSGPPAALTLEGHPLELVLLTAHGNVVVGAVVQILVQPVMDKLGAQRGDGVHRLAVFADV